MNGLFDASSHSMPPPISATTGLKVKEKNKRPKRFRLKRIEEGGYYVYEEIIERELVEFEMPKISIILLTLS